MKNFPRSFGSMVGRVALVTGASSGIGAAIMQLFVEKGGRVHAVARRGSEIERIMGEDSLARGSTVVHEMDVSDSDAMTELGTFLAGHDPIDTLVLAAGTNIPNRRLSQVTIEDWNNVIATNLSGAFYPLTATIDQLRDRQGDVVFVSSVSARWPDHAGPAYGASKSGLLGLAAGTGLDEHMNGVRVTSILPGIVNTAILDKRPIPPSQELREWCVQPEDVAQATLTAVTMPPRTNLAEITVVATRLQTLGKTQEANPTLPEDLRAS